MSRDYILIGYVGRGYHHQTPELTPLTAQEQYSYISMRSLMAAPLFYSGVVTRLNAFTLNVLCNSEVIDIDQDVLGKQAVIVRHTATEFVLPKTLEDVAMAVGLFNLSPTTQSLAIIWAELGLKGRYRIRTVWRQQDIGGAADEFATVIQPHGVALLRLARAE